MNEFAYFILRWADANIYPRIEADDVNLSYLSGSKILDSDDVPLIKMRLGEPVPPDSLMADYHPIYPVFSPKVANVIRSYNLDYIQIFPSVIRGMNNKLFDYYYVYIANKIRCLDFNKSICEKTPEGNAANLKKIVLDYDALRKVHFNQRVIFKIREASSKILFHESIAEDILSLQPTNIHFIKVEDYYDGMEFN